MVVNKFLIQKLVDDLSGGLVPVFVRQRQSEVVNEHDALLVALHAVQASLDLVQSLYNGLEDFLGSYFGCEVQSDCLLLLSVDPLSDSILHVTCLSCSLWPN